MRFYTREIRKSYVVLARDYEVVHGHRKLVRGLEAQFVNHLFDSEMAQKNMRWTNEERKAVERYLLEHGDFGNGLYLAEDRPTEPEMPEDQSKPLQIRCVATIPTTEGSRLCGEDVVPGGDLCAKHQAEFERAKAALSGEPLEDEPAEVG